MLVVGELDDAVELAELGEGGDGGAVWLKDGVGECKDGVFVAVIVVISMLDVVLDVEG